MGENLLCMRSDSEGRECDDVRLIEFYPEDGDSRSVGNGYICLHPRIL